MERRLAAILAADVVGYTRLMGADEVGTLARAELYFYIGGPGQFYIGANTAAGYEPE